MKSHLRSAVGALPALLLAGSPALAQVTAQNTTAPAQSDVVGPPQLRDFSLNGTVTREAPAPAEQQPRPQPEQRSTTPAPTRPTSPPTQERQAQTPRSQATPSQSLAVPDFPATTPAPQSAEPPETLPQSSPALPTEAEAAVPASSSFSILPWLIAALAVAGAAAAFFLFRSRRREKLAGVHGDPFDIAPAAEPHPAPPAQPTPPTPPGPAPQPAVPAATGIVSTRLRPWLEIEFRPDRGVVDDQKAAIAFEMSVFNSGNAPARDVLIEASLFNAGPMQDQQIQLFFDNPVARGDSIPVIPPQQRVTVNTAVFLQRDKLQPIEIEGRPLFVPMVAFNALYRWGSSKGQTSASFLVGKQTGGAKLAPFRLDLGSRIFRNLAAREHELRVRK